MLLRFFMGCIFSDCLLRGNNLLSQIRFAEKCPLCELKDVFVTERYYSMPGYSERM